MQKMAPKLVVLQSWRILKFIEKKFISKMVCGNVLTKMSIKIFNFWWSHGSEKLFFRTKSLIKCKRKKIKKILHIYLQKVISQIILQSFCKIRSNPKELELLEKQLIVFFSKRFVSEVFIICFNLLLNLC